MQTMTMTHKPGKSTAKFWKTLNIYKPFIIGSMLALLGTYILELLRSSQGFVPLHELMNSFMGMFFIVFSVPKFFSLSGFAQTFRQYDLLSQKFPLYGRIYPFIELGLGLLLLSDYQGMNRPLMILLNLFIVGITSVAIVGISKTLAQKKEVACACMGTAFSFPLSKVAVFENGMMFVMALSMIVLMDPSHMTMVSLTHFRILG